MKQIVTSLECSLTMETKNISEKKYVMNKALVLDVAKAL